MIKRNSMMIMIAVIVLGAACFFISSSLDDTDDHQTNPQSNDTSPSFENKEDPDDSEMTLDHLFDLSEKGKIPDSFVVVGETTADEVKETLGAPEATSHTDVGLFLNYPSYGIDVGITDGMVSDLRSFQETFTSYDFETILSYANPDETRFYQDENHDHIILVYELANNYTLKWVLPKPLNTSTNPNVDHISLSRDICLDCEKDDGEKDGRNNDSSPIKEDMSLNEKIGQMIFSGIEGTEITPETKRMMEKYHVGGIILLEKNILSTTQIVHLLNDLKTANASHPYPLFLGIDEEGGSVTRMPDGVKSLPSSRSIAGLNDPNLSFKVGAILGEQLNTLGFNMDFAPVLDINSNPNNPVIGDRSFGSNPTIVTSLGIQTMKGIQNEGIISVVKHFPGHGATDVDSHIELPQVDKSQTELAQFELIPFQEAISEGADAVMIAHILFPSIDASFPASLSHKVITAMLREKYGFDGVVITDDLTMNAISSHYHIGDAAVQSVKAGADILLIVHNPSFIPTVVDQLKAAVENGEISEDRIDESVERIKHLKEKYQLSDHTRTLPDVQSLNEKVEDIWEQVP